MKLFVSLLIALTITGMALAAPKKDLSFAKMKFVHAWSDKKKAITTDEYVEPGKTLDNWQHMLAYRSYPTSKEPTSVIKTYLKQIKKPTQEPSVYRRSDSDLMLVFLIEAPDKSYAEFNIHRFVAEDGMVRSYQFAARNWKRDFSSLTAEVKENREKWMEAVGNLKQSDFNQ
ncbi:hypothetical protein [Geotalea sp. SG265]|uniref:hypothetical protein n=1 Tax=Geotalea sp. SG265 TaxID=2922867 RepID=UPI001FAFB1F6|nr:hypothetical protein [Geotalea sp. SG265]